MVFQGRQDAGRRLGEALRRYKGRDAVVLGLPRGGIVLAKEVVKRLKAPLGVVLVRKIGHPNHPEYAIGALADGENPIYRQSEIASVDKSWLKNAENTARKLLNNRRELYHDDDIPQPLIRGSTVILVDDGIATGLTMKAAVIAMRNKHAKRIIAAAPVSSADAADSLKQTVDELVILDDTSNFLGAVGAHYEQFDQVKDEEVRRLLKEASYELHQAAA